MSEINENGRHPLLSLQSVGVTFGGVRALDDISFDIAERSKVGLIGPNGAGKTTLFNCISHLVSNRDGRILFDGQDLAGVPPFELIKRGIARTFQAVGLVPEMTVIENVLLGAGPRGRRGFALSSLVPSSRSTIEKVGIDRAWELLESLELTEHANELASDLPLGTQKRIELARAVMNRPRLLMLDEPANGLTLTEVLELREVLQRLWEDNDLTLLVVEHHMGFVMGLCDDVVVLDAGKLLSRGAPSEVQNNPLVIEAYLGRRSKKEALDGDSHN